MLVLTTMFINVSNNLPKTSYIKMMDIWLIFNLLVPFIEICLHTYMDILRYNNKNSSRISFDHEYQRTEEEREINHHGRPVKVSGEEDDETMDQHNQVESFYFMIIKKDIFKVSPMPPVSVNEAGLGGSIKLISTNEKTQQKALKDHYER